MSPRESLVFFDRLATGSIVLALVLAAAYLVLQNGRRNADLADIEVRHAKEDRAILASKAGVIELAMSNGTVEQTLSDHAEGGTAGRFLLVRSDSGRRTVGGGGEALLRLPLNSADLIGTDLADAGLPGWRLFYLRDRTGLQRDLETRNTIFDRRVETVGVLTAALVGIVLLIRRLARANGRLRHQVAQLREARERIREKAALLDEAQEAIYTLDDGFRVLFWNRAAERLYGLPAREARGRDVREILFSKAGGAVPTPVEIFREKKWIGELSYAAEGGKTVSVESHWVALHDGDGKPRRIFVIDEDVTEKKSFETQLRRAQRMENIGALASGVAHDLNNALTPVIVGLQLLEETEGAEERAALSQTILSSALRGTAMVKQILGFVRGTQGEDAPVQIGHLVDEMVKIVRDTFPRSVTIESRSAKGLRTVVGNATELHQVLLNLCVNARDAMLPRGGRLVVAAENGILTGDDVAGREGVVPGPCVVLSVTDSGSGIPPEVLPRIFEPLFTTKDPGKGTGLGLSTVAAIVRRMGGFIAVGSEIGLGTTFTIRLPALSAPEAEERQEPVEGLPVGRGEKILLIDDDNTVRRLSKVMLENYGYRVISATNGLEGISVFNQHEETISLVISDIDMPYMDGLEVAATLRRKRPSLPVILISGSGEPEELAGVVRDGVGFLIKPYTVEGLVRIVGRHVGGAGRPFGAG